MNKDKYILGLLPISAALLFGIVWIATLLSAGTMAVTYSIANAPTPLPTNTPTVTPIFTATAEPSATLVPAEPTNSLEVVAASPTNTTAVEQPGTTEVVVDEPSSTPEPLIATSTPAPSETPDLTATQLAGAEADLIEMQAAVNQLYADEWIDTLEGEYHTLPNYWDAWNLTDPPYRVTYSDFSPSNFVVRATAFWQTSNVVGTTPKSGCGFVFREESEGNHFLIFLGMDGRIHMRRMLNGSEVNETQSVLVPIDVPEGNAEIMLAVSGSKVTFFVNGIPWFDPQNYNLTFGNFGLATVTGTSVGLGTECRMENVQLWIVGNE